MLIWECERTESEVNGPSHVAGNNQIVVGKRQTHRAHLTVAGQRIKAAFSNVMSFSSAYSASSTIFSMP